MRKIMKYVCIIAVTITLLTGCSLRTVDQMYCLPKRSESYNDLQVAIDSAMTGLEYCAPRSGENQQTVQMADLDGDGTAECLLFAKGTGEKPLQILIFKATADGYELLETISSYGTSFDQVEYVHVDNRDGYELVVGRQLSDQVVRSASVYSFASGESERLITANYTKFLTCNLDGDESSEILVLRSGESMEDNGVAEYYSFVDGVMERSPQVPLSEPADQMKRIMLSCLEDGSPAVFVASSVDEEAIITDVFSIVNGRFVNVSLSNDSGTSVKTLRNYFIYADDIDEDGVMELPDLISMHCGEKNTKSNDQQYAVRWYSMMPNGEAVDKLYTYHNYDGGWYLELDKAWMDSLCVIQNDGEYGFFLADESGQEKEKILTIYSFTGKNREEQAITDNRFVLDRGESVVYAAQLEVSAAFYGIDPQYMLDHFHLIRMDWKSGET